jgi:hypothetical protein
MDRQRAPPPDAWRVVFEGGGAAVVCEAVVGGWLGDAPLTQRSGEPLVVDVAGERDRERDDAAAFAPIGAGVTLQIRARGADPLEARLDGRLVPRALGDEACAETPTSSAADGASACDGAEVGARRSGPSNAMADMLRIPDRRASPERDLGGDLEAG